MTATKNLHYLNFVMEMNYQLTGVEVERGKGVEGVSPLEQPQENPVIRDRCLLDNDHVGSN